MELTDNEIKIITFLRTLQPFEYFEVHADKTGKIDYYIIHRSYKVILANEYKNKV